MFQRSTLRASDGGVLDVSLCAGLVGLTLSYVLPVTDLLNNLLTSSAETGEA